MNILVSLMSNLFYCAVVHSKKNKRCPLVRSGLVASLLLIIALTSCSRTNYFDILSSRKINSLVFSSEHNHALGFDVEAVPDQTGLLYTAIMPKGMLPDAQPGLDLVPFFDIEGFALYIDGKRQTNGTSSVSLINGTNIDYVLYSYDGKSTNYTVIAKNADAWFNQFGFDEAQNVALTTYGNGSINLSESDIEGNAVWFDLPHAISLKGLVCSFGTEPEGVRVCYVNSDGKKSDQTSGKTARDYSDYCVYRVYDSRGETFLDYKVSAYRLTYLSFDGYDDVFSTGGAYLSDNSINVELAYGTNLSSLKPVFTYKGDAITFDGTTIESGTNALDFSDSVTNPVVIEVSTRGGKSKLYNLTVTTTSSPSVSPHNPPNDPILPDGSATESGEPAVPLGNTITNIKLSHDDISLEIDQTVQLNAILEPADVTDTSVIWQSDNPSVVSVSASGLVTATGGGQATVTVTSVSGGKSAHCSVQVSSESVSDETTTYKFVSGGTEFKIITTPYVDLSAGPKFPTGTGDDEPIDPNVPARFIIGETEVTYALWYEVFQWATDASIDHDGDGSVSDDVYTFALSGAEGSMGTAGNPPTMDSDHPVVNITWRDALVWCNALTEYHNAHSVSSKRLKCVYYTDSTYTNPLRSVNKTDAPSTVPGSQDVPYIYAAHHNNTAMYYNKATGYRLPLSIEWEYAARYRGTDNTNSVTSYSNPYYTKGNSASGATDPYDSVEETEQVAIYNSSTTAAVKTKLPNTLKLYDMSGNAAELCFDGNPGYVMTQRVLRGGGYINPPQYIRLGLLSGLWVYHEYDHVGFRVVRSLPGSYRVTYIANGISGTAPVDENLYHWGAYIRAANPENLNSEPVAGHSGSGIRQRIYWTTNANGSGTKYERSEGIKITGDITLYAQKTNDTTVIGKTGPAGGFVFYDKGTYSDDWRYMELASAAIADEYSPSIWGDVLTVNVGTSADIGKGKENTANIIANTGYTNTAAKSCSQYRVTVGSVTYDDWFLPSQLEMLEVAIMNQTLEFLWWDFWTSTEVSGDETQYAYVYWINGDGFAYSPIYTYLKNSPRRIQAVRQF